MAYLWTGAAESGYERIDACSRAASYSLRSDPWTIEVGLAYPAEDVRPEIAGAPQATLESMALDYATGSLSRSSSSRMVRSACHV